MSTLLRTKPVVGPESLAPSVVSVEAGSDRSVRPVSVVKGGGGIEWDSGPDLSAGRLHTGGDPA